MHWWCILCRRITAHLSYYNVFVFIVILGTFISGFLFLTKKIKINQLCDYFVYFQTFLLILVILHVRYGVKGTSALIAIYLSINDMV